MGAMDRHIGGRLEPSGGASMGAMRHARGREEWAKVWGCQQASISSGIRVPASVRGVQRCQRASLKKRACLPSVSRLARGTRMRQHWVGMAGRPWVCGSRARNDQDERLVNSVTTCVLCVCYESSASEKAEARGADGSASLSLVSRARAPAADQSAALQERCVWW